MAICKQCGEPFHPTKPWQSFCDPNCRDRWHYENRKALAYAQAVEQHEAEMEANGGDHGTPEQREQATQALAGITREFVPSVGKFVRRV